MSKLVANPEKVKAFFNDPRCNTTPPDG
jgi:hypothetical protein